MAEWTDCNNILDIQSVYYSKSYNKDGTIVWSVGYYKKLDICNTPPFCAIISGVYKYKEVSARKAAFIIRAKGVAANSWVASFNTQGGLVKWNHRFKKYQSEGANPRHITYWLKNRTGRNKDEKSIWERAINCPTHE